MDLATGEEIEDWDNVSIQYSTFTFFSITDLSDAIEFSHDILLDVTAPQLDWADLTLSASWLTPISFPPFASPPIFIHSDAETGLAYYMVRHNGATAGEVDSVNIGFTLNHIMGDFQSNSDAIEAVDLLNILENHQAEFIRRPNTLGFRGFSMPFDLELEEWEWDSPSMITPITPGWNWMHDDWQSRIPEYIEVTQRGQLNIPLHDGTYLTNLALRGNYLHVQLREYEDLSAFHHFSNPFGAMDHLDLVDTRANLNALIADFAIDTNPIWSPYMSFRTPEQLDQMMEQRTQWDAIIALQREFRMVSTIDLSIVNTMNHRPVNNQRYTERIYRIASPEVLEHLVFEVTQRYFAISLTPNLTVPTYNVRMINYSVSIDAEAEIVTAMGQPTVISDITITPLGVSFTIHGIDAHNAHLWGRFADVFVIYDDGSEVLFDWVSMNSSPHLAFHMGIMERPATMQITMTGSSTIDMSRMTAVRIGGVTFEI